MTGVSHPADNKELHVAIIMDGNGRWATRQNMPRTKGHEAGLQAIRHIVEAAPEHGIGVLTLYAFSSDNWHRPSSEVSALMRLMQFYLRTETGTLVSNGVRLKVIGRRDRLPAGLPESIDRAEQATANGTRLYLRVAVDYSARNAILDAAMRAAGHEDLTRETFSQLLTRETEPQEVDLLIRTGGEKRLSDFLLWEIAYAEILFSDQLWPDFDRASLAAALAFFRGRERRFGGVQAVSQGIFQRALGKQRQKR